jgi:hypothetical protein
MTENEIGMRVQRHESPPGDLLPGQGVALTHRARRW